MKLVPESLDALLEAKNTIKGGKGDKLTKDDVCPKQFAVGKKVEMEHTNSQPKATEIVLDHLKENPKYYSELVEKGLVDEKPAIKEYIKQFGDKNLSKKLQEAMDFERGSDPRRSMGLGKKVQIEKDLEEAGINPMAVEITDDLIIKNKSVWDSQLEALHKIQMKHLPPKWRNFIKELREGDPKKAVDSGLEEGIDPEVLEDLISEFGKFKEGYQQIDHKTPAHIYLKKITRDEDRIREDEEYNDYAFIAFKDKVPVMVNGEKYYKDGWGTEGMIKIDKFDPSSLNNITGMKLRARYTGRASDVYIISVPSDFMDEERYEDFPDIIRDNFDEYLKKGIIRRM